MLKIVHVPNKMLNSPVRPVKKIDQSIKKLVLEMEETLVAQDDPPGVGLAASQVGKNLALFIIKPTPKAKIGVFINPKICQTSTVNETRTDKQKRKSVKLEGCLSIPRIWAPVKRAQRVLLEYQDLEGQTNKKWFGGLEAIIIQHEIDHLNGVVFTQKAIEQNQPLYREKEGELERYAL